MTKGLEVLKENDSRIPTQVLREKAEKMRFLRGKSMQILTKVLLGEKTRKGTNEILVKRGRITALTRVLPEERIKVLQGNLNLTEVLPENVTRIPIKVLQENGIKIVMIYPKNLGKHTTRTRVPPESPKAIVEETPTKAPREDATINPKSNRNVPIPTKAHPESPAATLTRVLRDEVAKSPKSASSRNRPTRMKVLRDGRVVVRTRTNRLRVVVSSGNGLSNANRTTNRKRDRPTGR